MPELKYLSWDSNFFNLKIGKLIFTVPEEMVALPSFLTEAHQSGFDCIYVFIPEAFSLNQELLKSYNGQLVDIKYQYSLHLHQLPVQLADWQKGIMNYDSEEISSQLIALALQSGAHSRFKLDQNFATESFEKLYTEWISKSISKDIADYVYTYCSDEEIVGMVTFKIKNNCAIIGLFGVQEGHRSKGIGSKLLQTVFTKAKELQLSRIEVATQRHNISACRFYEKSGFIKQHADQVFHFWPKKKPDENTF